MTRRIFATADAPQPSGGYSQAVRIGNLVWAAGQGGFDPTTRKLVGDDIESQTEQTMRNLEAVLVAAGAGLDDVVRVGVFISDLDLRSRMNVVYAPFFGENPPARTTVGVDLPAGLLVEIDAMAVLS